MTARTFDWKPRTDPKQLDYPIRSLATLTLPYKYHRAGPVLDQGSEGACVGHAVVGALTAAPLSTVLREPQAAAFGTYRIAQFYDEWAGEAYSGTSVMAGLTIAKMMGMIKGFYWSRSLEEVLAAMSLGVVVFGMDWHEGMMEPDASGRIHASGAVVGGHAVAGTGFSRTRRLVRIRQSWGASHGVHGNVWIGFDDLAKLLAAGGEAALPIV